ncbi:MAG TPA: hypothetical protein DCY07_07315 [Rhodospirillaceae bacterium]|nr:hypothetical protein [Rhodospirillaceae bacterium]
MPKTDCRKYRRASGVVLVNPEGLVLLGMGSWKPHFWRMPQGGIDAGETPEETIGRELMEETGVLNFCIIGKASRPYTYDYPALHACSSSWRKTYKGQSITWFHARAFSSKTDHEKYVPLGDEPEFIKLSWVNPAVAIARTHSKLYGDSVTKQRQESYKNVFSEFGLPLYLHTAPIRRKYERISSNILLAEHASL